MPETTRSGREAGEGVLALAELREGVWRDVLEGLRRPDKRIPSKYHYDERGSELFEQITRLEEYYLTRTERALLERWMPIWVEEFRPATMIELGAGNSEKSRIALDAMVETGSGRTYVPVDVSRDFLQTTARRLGREYPALVIRPEFTDITADLWLPRGLPSPVWIAFLGSTLGNFEPDGAVGLLGRIARVLDPGDQLILGVDLRPGPNKSVERIELAYNDPPGVTKAFTLNVLEVLNRAAGSDFDVTGFRHRSHYSVDEGRIETYLESLRDQVVTFPEGEEVSIASGESIRTEISSKYDRATIDDLFDRAGLIVTRWMEDELGFYAVVLGETTG